MAEGVYPGLSFGPALPDRPYVAINMVATIDGKTVSGGRDETVEDLGSPTDHATMRQIESAGDAVLIGAGLMRATPGLWYPRQIKRFVATRGGDLDWQSRFFTDAPDQAWVVGPAAIMPAGTQCLDTGGEADWHQVLGTIRRVHGVERLIVEGGSELNAGLLKADLVDELFLTLAPKIKLGRDVATYAGGEPLARSALLQFSLVSCQPVGDEVFLRYRRAGVG